ncbi:hypothetical protein [Rhodococcus jostii]|uniref:hypothetical protein n=1 Tax=Rhodococcus jostii TaxID=132919 RepID=UPI00362FBF3E
MTELAHPDDQHQSVESVEEYRSAITDWAKDAYQANRVAQSLANTTFVPASMRGKPAEITAAILTGQEIGLSPMSALRSIDIIQGTPAMQAHALRGLVQSQGHEVWIEDATDTRVIVAGKRKGSTITQRTEWSIDRARQLGLLGKDNWKKQPRAMLIARATAELCRLIASDVLLGLPYSSEELSDESNAQESAESATSPKVRRTVKRASAPAEEPALGEGPAPTEDPAAGLTPVEPSDEPAVAEPGFES